MAGLNDKQLRSALAVAGEGGVDLDQLGAVVVARAEAEGIVEVTFTELDSPLGPLLAAATDRGLIQLNIGVGDLEATLVGLAAAVGPRVVESAARFESLERQLDEYFGARRQRFELPLDWRLSQGFVRRVLRATAEIPYGETRSYAEIAKAAGNPRAYRAAGSALGANPIPVVVPCHRVLRSGGALGGYAGGLGRKQQLLELERAAA